MSFKAKIVLSAIVLGAAVIFSGCSQNSSRNGSQDQTPNKNTAADSHENLPEPTGKIDDVVNATLEDATKEKAEVLEEENDAKALVDDSREADDFGQSYDEKEL